MLGQGFMGRAHAHALLSIGHMTGPPLMRPQLVALGGRDRDRRAALGESLVRAGFSVEHITPRLQLPFGPIYPQRCVLLLELFHAGNELVCLGVIDGHRADQIIPVVLFLLLAFCGNFRSKPFVCRPMVGPLLLERLIPGLISCGHLLFVLELQWPIPDVTLGRWA